MVYTQTQLPENALISPKGDTVFIKPISLLEISPKIGDFNAKVKRYQEDLKTMNDVYKIDTSVASARGYLEIEKNNLVENMDQLILVQIDNAKREWKVGSVTISFGGIIAFLLVILITSVVTKTLNYLLEEEVFPRVKLGRGVPGAISMVVRYSLGAFGVYVALSAAGVDLGQFGQIAGALGVGIGFGLQSIVFNFIAGLKLAFERPIQK